jgi:hypothetical protein
MLFLRKANSVVVVLLVGIIVQLIRTDAFPLRLRANSVRHQTSFSGKQFSRNIAQIERVINIQENSWVGKNNHAATKLSAAATDDESGEEENQATLLGTLILLTVPLSWGTYVPVGESVPTRIIACFDWKSRSSLFTHNLLQICWIVG